MKLTSVLTIEKHFNMLRFTEPNILNHSLDSIVFCESILSTPSRVTLILCYFSSIFISVKLLYCYSLIKLGHDFI